MCYNTKLQRQIQEMERWFQIGVHVELDYESQELIFGFDYPYTPVITNKEPRTISLLKWGLIPSWSLDDSIKKNTLNARIETLHERKSFKQSVQNRCLVIADGFYEKNKTILINKPEGQLFAFAGIYSPWTNPVTNETINTYSIVTTKPNDFMKDIHSRMPVVLSKENQFDWLGGASIEQFKNVEVELVAENLSMQQSLF